MDAAEGAIAHAKYRVARLCGSQNARNERIKVVRRVGARPERRKRLASIIEKADSKKTGESVKEVFSSSLPKKNKFKTQLKSFDSLQIPQKKKNFKEPKLADENDVANVPFSELLRRATSGKSYTENGKLFENSKKSRKRNRG